MPRLRWVNVTNPADKLVAPTVQWGAWTLKLQELVEHVEYDARRGDEPTLVGTWVDVGVSVLREGGLP